MGSIKDRNGMYLTETEDVKKRCQEYTEELYREDLHDPDNHDGMVSHLEPDILECLYLHHQLLEFTHTHVHWVHFVIIQCPW